MLHRLSGSLFVWLALTGCVVGTGPSAINPWTVHVLPVAPTSQGSSSWTEETLAKRTAWLPVVFVDTGLKFQIDPIKYEEHPTWTKLDDHTRIEMQTYAAKVALTDGKLVVFLCSELEFEGARVAGLSNFPTNLPEEAYGIWLDRLGSEKVLAHEMGHAFGLKHPIDPNNCDVERCNIMAYCGAHEECESWLTPEQVAVVQLGARSISRWPVVTPR